MASIRPEPPPLATPKGREAILDAATALFAEHGYNDADTQALAERLGVGKGTLYRHFASKRELFLAAVDRVMRRMREHIDASIAEVEAPLDRLAVAIRAYLDFFASHPEYVELLIQERALFRDREKPTYFEYRERNAVQWREMLSRLDGRGPAPRDARGADQRRGEQPGLRDHVHQLLHGPAEIVRGAIPGHPGCGLPGHLERSRTTTPAAEEVRDRA